MLLGGLTVFFTYLISLRALPGAALDRGVGGGAGGVQPQFIFISAGEQR
ncbi:MAG: hypothetical protein R3A10_01680 [Caldilineaceae bacterium]